MCVVLHIFEKPCFATACVEHTFGDFHENSTQNTPIIAPTEHSHLTGSRQMELNPSDEMSNGVTSFPDSIRSHQFFCFTICFRALK